MFKDDFNHIYQLKFLTFAAGNFESILKICWRSLNDFSSFVICIPAADFQCIHLFQFTIFKYEYTFHIVEIVAFLFSKRHKIN